MSTLHQQLRKEIGPRTLSVLTLPIFIICGPIISFLGYGAAVLVALTFGFPAPPAYGGASGIEGMALFAGMVGAAVASLGMIALWLRGSVLQRWMMVAYTGIWLVTVVIHHYVVLSTNKMVPAYVVAPIMITGAIMTVLLRMKSLKRFESGSLNRIK